MRILFQGIMAGGWFALLATPSLAESPKPPAPATEALAVDIPVPMPVYSSPELDKESAGLPRDSRPAVLTWERVFGLAWNRFRADSGPNAETLVRSDLQAQAKKDGVDNFARFGTDFLANGAEGRRTFPDPSKDYLELLRRLQSITSARRELVLYESLLALLRELIQGGSSGLSQIDVDRVNASLRRARQRLADEVGHYRNELDEMKVALGLSPHAAIVADRRVLAAFGSAFEGVDQWHRDPRRDLAELHKLVGRLPVLGDVTVGGRSLLGAVEPNPNTIEEILTDAVREAFKNQHGGAQHGGQGQQVADVQLELKVRRRVRHLLEIRSAYDGEKHSYELAARLKDQALERLFSPATASTVPRSTLTEALLAHSAEAGESEARLVGLWTEFRAERLALYHDIGFLPYSDWKSFYAELWAGPVVALEPEGSGHPPAPKPATDNGQPSTLEPEAAGNPPAPGDDRLPVTTPPRANPQAAPPAPKARKQPAPQVPAPPDQNQPRGE